MKVLTFCAYYEPEIAASMYITTNLFEDMAKAGIEVEVYAPTPTRGVDQKTIEKYRTIKYEEKYDGKLKIHRFFMFQEGKGVLIRAIRYILLNLVFVWKGLFTNADIMFIDSTPPTQGIMAAIIKRIRRIPIVYNLQDIFPDSLEHTGICKKNSLIYKIGRVIEKITYRYADAIIAISDDFKINILNKGVMESKIEVVNNWVDEKTVHYTKKEENILYDKYNIDRSKFYVSYCGNIGLTQNMDLLVDVAESLKEYKDIGFIIVGDGVYKKKLLDMIQQKSLNNIILIPFQDYKYIANVFSLGDVGLIISKAGVGNNSVPSKTWSYMAAERAIIASFDINSELCRIITGTQSGICCKADDATSLRNAILELWGNPNCKMGNNGRRYIEENLSRRKNTEKYIQIIKRTKLNLME